MRAPPNVQCFTELAPWHRWAMGGSHSLASSALPAACGLSRRSQGAPTPSVFSVCYTVQVGCTSKFVVQFLGPPIFQESGAGSWNPIRTLSDLSPRRLQANFRFKPDARTTVADAHFPVRQRVPRFRGAHIDRRRGQKIGQPEKRRRA